MTPDSFALIPEPEQVHIPPRYAQHLNSLAYIDFMPVQRVDEHGNNLVALRIDRMRNDNWLQLWAMTAMDNDGSFEPGGTLETGQTSDQWAAMDTHVIAVLYMDAFITAERSCSESREEIAGLVKAYAGKVEVKDNVYPRLSVISSMWSEGGATCGDYLASLQQMPLHEFCFVSACVEEFNARAESGGGPNG